MRSSHTHRKLTKEGRSLKKTSLVLIAVACVLVFSATALATVTLQSTNMYSGAVLHEGLKKNIDVLLKTTTESRANVRVKVIVTGNGGIVPADLNMEGVTFASTDASTVAGYATGAFNITTNFNQSYSLDTTFAAGTAGAYVMTVQWVDATTDAVVNLGTTPATISFSFTVGAAAGSTPVPTVIGSNGQSMWSYEDLSDGGTAKYEGGYAIFDDLVNALYDNPHGNYDTSTNKCKVCHAVHRAEGAYYLLRADSQDDACDYCHIGGSAHSSLEVYDLNAAGKYTSNGHTIGAQTQIPDSTTYQWTEEVTLSTTDANGDPVTETIHVRAYDSDKNEMFRFTRHHGHGAVGAGRSAYVKVGPLALRCMNCHQTHGATNQMWRPAEISGVTVGARGDGYKLLRLFPSGTTLGDANAYGYYDPSQVVKAPETTLTAGVNYSQSVSGEFTYDEFGDGSVYSAPVWVAQHIGPEAGHEHGGDRDANSVTEAALSVWCADCHNLNIGGWESLADVELGFKSHTERTHPAPYTGAYSGPGQCYSCHRNDLPQKMGGTELVTGNPVPNSPAGASRNSCEQCHFGAGSYATFQSTASWDSDFPHSGRATDIKLLGSYSVNPASPTTIVGANITDSNLDAVCLRCHGGIGTNH